ncbi:Glycoside hydrolase, 38 vacuolar alpha mannosidase [Coemansia asiatica]|uniref:Glycoside hydrolase, 38 vacuolar alpha mannosidase n=1 Tax=Coemansia asiatica TaxID=1052880 RepID=A0A9W7XPB6_9FUNG|nr:Glycoside hydrolase, 38 vacuolar alpha mannosidase [Coemansia asiatica]
MLSAIAHSLGKDLVYLAAEITCLWKLMCLNQFHNMIPGSSIEMVFEDSDKIYVDILESARDMKENAIVALFGDSSMCAAEQATSTLVFNSTSWPCTDVVAVPGMSQGLGAQQVHKQDQATLMVTASVPSSGMQIVSPVNDANVVPVSAYCDSNGHFVLENLYVMAKFNASSHLASFVD